MKPEYQRSGAGVSRADAVSKLRARFGAMPAQVLQLPPTFDLSMKQKATASMTARLASERPRLLPGGMLYE